MEPLLRDLGHAARTLRKSPGFSLTAIATLALGIGVSTAIFSVVNAVLLRPLPYGEADRLTIITQDLRVRGVTDFAISPADVADIRDGATLLDGLAAVQAVSGIPLEADGAPPEPIVVALATTNVFDVLQVPVVHGRNFTATDGTPERLPPPPPAGTTVVQGPNPTPLPTIGILSHGFWQRRYGSDSSIIGRSITALGGPVQIVGIASPRAELLFPLRLGVPRYPDVWTALRVDFAAGSRQDVEYRLIGRIKSGVSVGAARAQIENIGASLRERFPVRKTSGVYFRLEPMKQYLVADVRTAVLALMGAVLFVLVIACANVANLLLVRAAHRERELAVRAAMGGSPWAIMRQLLAESVLLAAVAAVAGIGLARLGIALLLQLAPANLPRLAEVSADPTVLRFTVVASVVAAIIFGVVPAIRASRPDIAHVLRARTRTSSLGGGGRLRNAVIVAEVALSFVLLADSGLMIRSFVALTRTELGYDPAGVLTFTVSNYGMRPPEVRAALLRRIRETLSAIPGVTAATMGMSLPLADDPLTSRWGPIAAAGDPTAFRQGAFFVVMPGYFEAMRTRLITGRTFVDADNAPGNRAVVIDEPTAKLAFGTESPIGKNVLARMFSDEARPFTVIGVVAHQRHTTLTGEEAETIYFPPALIGGGGGGRWAVRTSGDVAALSGSVRAAITAVDPRLLLDDVRPMAAFVEKARSQTRFALALLGVFATIAAALSAVGLYGVLSNVVRQRTSEIGIRIALGARRSTIFTLVVGHGLKLSAIGLAIGLTIALATTRIMRSMLVDVRPTDPLTFTVMAAVFLMVSAMACWVPARRAAEMDPNVTLRME